MVKLVSACLVGTRCRWDGGDSLREDIRNLAAEGKAIAVCPEQLGGLPTPRPPAEIIGGGGEDVLDGKAKVVDNSGRDVTEEFVKGAEEVLRIARRAGARKAILKARSSSCGRGQVYDGTFSHRLNKGNGVTCALLMRAGIEVVTDESGLPA